ncbi:MAG: 3'-5' exonuclease [Actinobacteria bacterium]|nr:MAG: 3'-5' exonuclease [Actinomycetota bacterium]
MTPDRPSPPKRRSRRADWRAAELVALDFETTGLDLDRDEVISFGLIPVRDGRVDLSGQLYQEVAPGVGPSHSSIRIHHLRAQDLATAPAMHEVTDALRDALEGRFVLAWAAGVEIAFLRKVFGGGRRAWRRRTIDDHALDDAFMTAELFLVAANALEARGSGSIRDLLRITARG